MSRIQLDGIVDPLHESPSGCTDDVTPAPPIPRSLTTLKQSSQKKKRTKGLTNTWRFGLTKSHR